MPETMTTHTADVTAEQMVARYLDAWNATDPGARARLLEEHWAADCVYVDPLAEATGHQALGATIAAVQGQFPGLVFSLVGGVDAHHQQCRFQWGLGPAGQEPLVIGSDVLVLDDDGRIQDVRGFLDVVPE
jgi:hypothetical protein